MTAAPPTPRLARRKCTSHPLENLRGGHDDRLIILDSLNGYLQSMPEERFLIAQLHELLTYLRQQGVLMIMAVARHGFFGTVTAPVDISYLADTVVLTRFFEAHGRVRKAVSVLKKRSGRHEDTIRELTLASSGVMVGAPLTDFHGVLSGIPLLESAPHPAPREEGPRA